MDHWPGRTNTRCYAVMTLSAAPHAPLPIGRLLGGLLAGSALVAAGLAAHYLTIATPFVSTLVPETAPSGSVGIGFGVWGFALIAGAALLVAGTDRLARLVAVVRHGPEGRGPAARALAGAVDDVAVASRVLMRDGPAIPELVIGAFGAAVVHQMPSSRLIRHGARWETRTSDGWVPMDDPLEAAARGCGPRPPVAQPRGPGFRGAGLRSGGRRRSDDPAVAVLRHAHPGADPRLDRRATKAADPDQGPT